ncbi:hypothetical protein ACIH2S_17505 [Providencia sp. PAZ2]|uniref:hypothetical protein n=1 Tax=Providencia lanzhouensis TaxID=3378099 RepID=UPI003D28EE4F
MSNYKTWINSLDNLIEKRQPAFRIHVLADKLNSSEKESYLKFHAAFLLLNGSISAEQKRLYEFWLPSLNQEQAISDILEQALHYSEEDISVFINLIEQHKILDIFLLDILVFSQLSGKLSAEQKSILNRILNVLNAEQELVDDVISFSRMILENNLIDKNNKSETILNLLLNNVWHEFYLNDITEDNLHKIEGGFWRLSESIEVKNNDITWNNTLIVYGDNCNLNISNSNFHISGSILLNPINKLLHCELKIDDCYIHGEYRKENTITVYESINTQSINIKNTAFLTMNARTFYFDEGKTTGLIEECSFKQCGHPELLGGAVNYQSGIIFKSSLFKNCTAKLGGAIFAKKPLHKSFDKVYFQNCHSVYKKAWNEPGGIYITYSERGVFSECSFDTPVSVYALPNCQDYDSNSGLMINSSVNTTVYYNCSQWGTSVLNDESVKQSGWTSRSQKAKYAEISNWEGCQNL